MSLSSFIERLISSENFKLHYQRLLLVSVRQQFSNLICEDTIENPDYNYLITCASILAQSKDGKFLDMAYRICQTGLCNSDLSEEQHAACGAILNILSNLPSIDLAIERNLISSNYLQAIPISNLMDIYRKQFHNTLDTGDQPIRLNDFQKEVYEAANKYKCISISAPTSVGKSFILLRIIEAIIEKEEFPKIVFVVPTRALIQQVELDIRMVLRSNHKIADVSSIPVKSKNWDNQACILVFTQERLQWFLNDNPDIKLDLIIIDEAQKIGDGSRGILLQQVLQQIAVSGPIRCIFAAPMCENPAALLNIVNDNSNENINIVSEIVTVNQNLIWAYQSTHHSTRWNLDLIYNNERLTLGYIESGRIAKPSMKLPILSYLLSGNQKGNLIYCNTAADAEKIATQIMSQIQADHVDKEPSQKIKNLIALVKKCVHPNYVLAEVLKEGVAFHYGNMPLIIRNEIEDLFKNGDITFLICTSTLIEGVNLPAKSIYIRGPKKGKSNPMSEMDFWNLAGRAGRQGKEFQGNIVCLDTDDPNVWKNGIPSQRKKYLIKSTIDSIIENNFDELLKYINSMDIVNSDSRLDYCYTYFLAYYFKYNGIQNSPLKKVYPIHVCKALDNSISKIVNNIELPQSILTKNQGINPIAQQNLLQYFRKTNAQPIDIIPPFPEDKDATQKYCNIINLISQFLSKDNPKLSYGHAVLVTQWMRGYGLSSIISYNISWNEKKHTGKSLQTIIRETMREIEEFARFKFLKYSNCYIDILKYYYISIGDNKSLEKIPQINLWLEFGASQQTQISLMSMGFTRTAALEISELMSFDNFTKDDCILWLTKNDYHSLNISATIIDEIDRILNIQTTH